MRISYLYTERKTGEPVQKKNKSIRQALKIDKHEDLPEGQINILSNDATLLAKYINSSTKHNFKTLMFELTHKNFTEVQAKYLWDMILLHKTELNKCLSRDVGILVATLDYLFNINKNITEPSLIEHADISTAVSIATTDNLTGLYLRDVLAISINSEIPRSRRQKYSVSFLMIDIDDFKVINDTFGHQEGDLVLKNIGRMISESTRPYDIAARYGGDEIAVLLPHANAQDAFTFAERLRIEIFEKYRDEKYRVSVSIGISTLEERDTAFNIIKNADKAVYRAKKAGKNRVLSYTDK